MRQAQKRSPAGSKFINRRGVMNCQVRSKVGVIEKGERVICKSMWEGKVGLLSEKGVRITAVSPLWVTWSDPENTSPRMNRQILGYLESALSAAKLTNCAVDPEHQDAMRLYLSSWVVGPLESALEEITKGTMYEERTLE